MNPYLCVTYAHDDRQESDLFCRSLTRYGFRYSCINQLSDPDRRGEILGQASLLIALTSSAAVKAETVAADIRHALERGLDVLCISLEENELNHRFCTGTAGGVALIPAPAEDTTDRHALTLFVHRLFVRHLARYGECFTEARCDDNVYGRLIRCAYYAHRGDGEACFELGRAYELGLGVPMLEKEAAIWLGRAAEQGITDALIRIGLLKLAGNGTDRDPEGAFGQFVRAAELGDIRGVYRQGLCYLDGQGVIKDPVHAIECLKLAAARQYAPAIYRLAILHWEGVGVDRNVHTALRYLYAVCKRGYTDEDDTRIPLPISVYGDHRPVRYTCITMRQMRHTRLAEQIRSASGRRSRASADRSFGRNIIRSRELPEDRWVYRLGVLYASEYRGVSDEEADTIDSHTIYEEEWTRGDAALAAYELGRLLAVGSPAEGLRPSPTRALVWYRYAARLGHIEALYELGDAYRRGYGTPKDTARSVELFRLAADGGSERGQFAYAVCCERGIGMAVDQREAFRRYKQSAEGGFAPAQNNLGGCYEAGIGVPRNMVAAVEWYASAANAGQPDGQCRLGVCYELGRGVPVDMDKALRLYDLAAEQGHAYALYRRALCYDRDTRADGEGEPEPDALVMETVTVPEGYRESPHRRGDTHLHVEAERRIAIDHTRAAALYKQAADLGVPEAAYALYLCHRLERGISRDERAEIRYLRRAAEGGCLQASYELGLCYMEGNGLPCDQRAAVARFTHTVGLWRACLEDSRLMAHLSASGNLPPDALTLRQAAGGALYMLGYCALYGLGEGRDNRTVDPAAKPDPDSVAKAAALFREASEIDHVGAVIMRGDLHAYGLLTLDAVSGEDESLDLYLDAIQLGTIQSGAEKYTRGISLRDPTDNTMDALMSVAERALAVARESEEAGEAEMDNGQPARAQLARAQLAQVNAWRSYSDCAARGGTDALVAMAECLYRGWGTTPNPTASMRMLRRAETMNGGRVEASLWLGDFLRSQWGGEPNPDEADRVYLRGLECPCLESECGPYTFGLRRVDRKRRDIRARAEILYRLATLRALHYADTANRRESFLYLAEAILMGHTAALDDLARMYAYESEHPRVVSGQDSRRRRVGFGRKARIRRRMRENDGMLNRNHRAFHVHQEWMSDYYTAQWPEPLPFSYVMKPTAIPSDLPEYVTTPVTDLMRANALQYLGECFYEGFGLPADAAAAVTCYRAVLAHAPKGGPTPPESVIQATYSLGWCLLYGKGTTANCQEGIRLLTSVSRFHAGACYTLGICHEEGRGVVAADYREAVKFYRKAQRLGYTEAAVRVAALEKQLRARGNTL